jgi:hypothetical protein
LLKILFSFSIARTPSRSSRSPATKLVWLSLKISLGCPRMLTNRRKAIKNESVWSWTAIRCGWRMLRGT